MNNKTNLANRLFAKSQTGLVLGFSLFLIVLGILVPRSTVFGDVVQNNTAGSWEGTLGPAAVGSANSDVDLISATVGINYNTTFTRYEAGLSANQTTGSIRSVDIVPGSGTLKNWKKIKFGFVRPTTGSSTVTIDILCGDPAQPDANCPTYGQPIPGFSNITLNANDEYDAPANLLATRIKLRVNFSRTTVTDAPILLYDWQVYWEVNSGVSLVVSKTPNPANPQEQACCGYYPGVANNYTVVYTLNYSLNRSVQNLTIELPVPSGVYTPAVGTPVTYTAVYIAGGTLSGNKVVWNLGNSASGTTGSVTASFKVPTGPPNGTVLKTKADIYGSDYSIVTLPDDLLNIQAKAFSSGYAISPKYIGKSTEVGYVLRMVARYYYYQSDMYNPRYEFVYDGCLDNTDPNYPKISGSGLASWSVDRPNRKIIFNLASPLTGTVNLDYSVTLKANPSCGNTTVGGVVTFYSDQDASFQAQKVTNVTYDGTNASIWDSTLTPHINIWKDGGPNPSGAGQLVQYALRFDQQSTVGAANFYALDQVPAQTTFVNTTFNPGVRILTGGLANNWKVYWITKATQPTQGDPGWTLFANSPCSSTCTVPSGQEGNVKWIKWEVGNANSFLWDRQENFDPPIGSLNVVTNTAANGTITNTIIAFANNVCTTGCPYNYPISINNQPYFNTSYVTCSTDVNNDGFPENCGISNPLDVNTGNYYWISGLVANQWDYGGVSHGDATSVTVTYTLPDRKYLDQTTPVDLSAGATFARCVMSGNSNSSSCTSDTSGTLANNPAWLYPANPATTCPTGGASGSCTLVWNIPVIFSYNKYPQAFPYQYNFYIKVKPRVGLLNQTTLCKGSFTLSVTSTAA